MAGNSKIFRSSSILLVLVTINTVFFILVSNYPQSVGDFVLTDNLHALYPKPWKIITYSFVHYSLQHYIFNTLVLICSALLYMRKASAASLAVTYLTGAFVGACMFSATCFLGEIRDTALIGSSCAVCAVIAGAIYQYNGIRINIGYKHIHISRRLALCFMSLIILSEIFTSNFIGCIGHLSGLFSGCITVKLFNGTKTVYSNPIIEKASVSGYSSLTDDEKFQILKSNGLK